MNAERCFTSLQVGSVPWEMAEKSTGRLAAARGAGPHNSTAADYMTYALLSCVAGTLTIVPYLRVSSLPKILLLLLLSVTYTAVMETSGYRQAVG